MFVDPKITLTRRVTDPAGTIRKARVLLDQHLRQDAAYNRQVSKSLYFIGPDVTCQITHEFNQTYIALDQKVQPEPVAAAKTKDYQFVIAGALTTLDTDPSSPLYNFNTVPAGGLQFWRSSDGASWGQFSPSQELVKPFQHESISASLSMVQLSQTEVFAVWTEELVGSIWQWGVGGIASLAVNAQHTVPTPSAFINNNFAVQSASLVTAGCIALLIQGQVSTSNEPTSSAAGLYVCWLDLASNTYIAEQPIADLITQENMTDKFTGTLVGQIYAMKTPKGEYNLVGLSISNPNNNALLTPQVLAFVLDINSGAVVSTSLTAAVQNPQPPGFVCGFDSTPAGEFLVSYILQSGAAQSLQIFIFSDETPPQLTGQLSIQLPNNFTPNYSLNWTPWGYAISFNYLNGWLYNPVLTPSVIFFSKEKILGVVNRPQPESPLLLLPFMTPRGMVDLLGTGLITSPTQNYETRIGRPPPPLDWGNPNNFFAQNPTAQFGAMYFFYLGPQLPEFVLY